MDMKPWITFAVGWAVIGVFCLLEGLYLAGGFSFYISSLQIVIGKEKGEI